jgi:hypothetical protein
MLRLNFYIATIGEQLAEHFPGDKDMGMRPFWPGPGGRARQG